MQGILLISHGPLAQAMLKTAEIFFGTDQPQLQALSLSSQETAEDYRRRLQEAVSQLDRGQGVVILADLMGGTPCTQTAFLDQDRITVITGMNLGMVMACLALRQGATIDPQALQDSACQGIVNYTQQLRQRREGAVQRKRRGHEPF